MQVVCKLIDHNHHIMVTYKLALDERRAKKDGTYPLVVRVTYNRKVTTFQTGVNLLPKHWNSKFLQVSNNLDNSQDLTHKASELYVKIQKAILTIERDGKFSFEALKEAISPKPIQKVVDITFLEFANEIIANFIKMKRTGNALVYRTAVNRVISYCNNPKLKFKDISFTFLDEFRNSLLQQGVKINTVGNYFRSIRAIFNKAIKAKVVPRDLYPFQDISIKTVKATKRAISVDELAKIFQHTSEINSQEWHAANYFFLSFALRGISFTDMAYLTDRNIHKGFITYKRRKTKSVCNVKLHPLAKSILQKYQNDNTAYLIPVFPKGTEEDSMAATKITRQWIKQTNKYLRLITEKCKVESKVTTYVARHTWATSAKRLGYSNEMIAEALGHEYGNKITNTYLDSFDEELIHQMNVKVIAGLYKCQFELKHNYRYILRYHSKLDTYVHYKRLFPYPLKLVKNRA